jgi:hypothetical protein
LEPAETYLKEFQPLIGFYTPVGVTVFGTLPVSAVS